MQKNQTEDSKLIRRMDFCEIQYYLHVAQKLSSTVFLVLFGFYTCPIFKFNKGPLLKMLKMWFKISSNSLKVPITNGNKSKASQSEIPIMNENKTTLVDILLQVVVSLTTSQHIP